MASRDFIRGGEPECEGCPHLRSYKKFPCHRAEDRYCDSEERCAVEEQALEAGKEQD